MCEETFLRHYFLQALKIALAFIGRIVFVRVMGATYLGINGLFSNILSILSIADLGMFTVMMYSLYRPLAERNENKIIAYINVFNKIYLFIAVAISVMGVAIAPFLKYIVNLPENINDIYLYYFLMLINTAIGYLFVYKTVLLQADQKSYIIDRVDMGMHIVLFITQTAVLLFTKNYVLYLCFGTIITLLSNLLKTNAVRKRYGYLSKKTDGLEKAERQKLTDDMKSLFLYKIGGVIQSNTDNILTSIFVGTIAVGYYSNYAMIVLAITNFVTTIFNSLKASIGSFNIEKSKGDQEKMFFYFEDYNYIIVGFSAICLYLLLPDFIRICFGEEYLLDTITVMFIIMNFYTSNIRQNIWVYRETTGIFSKVKYITLITSVLNVILSVVGGKLFGIAGIIAATVIARMLYGWWKEPTILFRTYFHSSPRIYLLTYAARLTYVCIISFILRAVINMVVIDDSILQFIIRAIIVSTMTVALLILPIANRDSIRILKDKYIRREKMKC